MNLICLALFYRSSSSEMFCTVFVIFSTFIDKLDDALEERQLKNSGAPIEQIIKAWKDPVVIFIRNCTDAVDTWLGSKSLQEGAPVKGGEWNLILEATTKLMEGINEDKNIVDDQKRYKCPIYEQLEWIVYCYGGPVKRDEFRNRLGSRH